MSPLSSFSVFYLCILLVLPFLYNNVHIVNCMMGMEAKIYAEAYMMWLEKEERKTKQHETNNGDLKCSTKPRKHTKSKTKTLRTNMDSKADKSIGIEMTAITKEGGDN